VLQAFIQAGLVLTHFEEFGGTILPWNIVIDSTLQSGYGAEAA
jgi:hypothetical protein